MDFDLLECSSCFITITFINIIVIIYEVLKEEDGNYLIYFDKSCKREPPDIELAREQEHVVVTVKSVKNNS